MIVMLSGAKHLALTAKEAFSCPVSQILRQAQDDDEGEMARGRRDREARA